MITLNHLLNKVFDNYFWCCTNAYAAGYYCVAPNGGMAKSPVDTLFTLFVRKQAGTPAMLSEYRLCGNTKRPHRGVTTVAHCVSGG
ncbi:MAG: hypothetical protein HZB37_09515 [Planctomycetes bacterium]|nr:hypothetical protein [Planctomycetota bacterium]